MKKSRFSIPLVGMILCGFLLFAGANVARAEDGHVAAAQNLQTVQVNFSSTVGPGWLDVLFQDVKTGTWYDLCEIFSFNAGQPMGVIHNLPPGEYLLQINLSFWGNMNMHTSTLETPVTVSNYGSIINVTYYGSGAWSY